VTLTFEF